MVSCPILRELLHGYIFAVTLSKPYNSNATPIQQRQFYERKSFLGPLNSTYLPRIRSF